MIFMSADTFDVTLEAPIFVPRCETGSFPQWIPVTVALPDSPRVVIVTDLEMVGMGCYCQPDGSAWECAVTEVCFDSVITHWMEAPDCEGLPEN